MKYPCNFISILLLAFFSCVKREKEKSFYEQFPGYLNPILSESSACSAATDAYPANVYPCYLKSEDPIFYRYDTNVFIDPSTNSVPQGTPIGCRCKLDPQIKSHTFNVFQSLADYPNNPQYPNQSQFVIADSPNSYIDSFVTGNVVVCVTFIQSCGGKKVYQKLLIE
ncbi:hypothetical protein JWG41_20060 [Leptospira sp. 201903075]|uniref:hypothetical protein n=1 Tax=Leptospira chreensis TaxID=2810035 RepID=UPI001962BC9B|nr:hypothetical protein [Leptospira chreensis]MBM9592427.1 hypothetical protein [Leptospira chreensis]MBM9592741.1 hypothetical protein [Leptospira chreensis]